MRERVANIQSFTQKRRGILYSPIVNSNKVTAWTIYAWIMRKYFVNVWTITRHFTSFSSNQQLNFCGRIQTPNFTNCAASQNKIADASIMYYQNISVTARTWKFRWISISSVNKFWLYKFYKICGLKRLFVNDSLPVTFQCVNNNVNVTLFNVAQNFPSKNFLRNIKWFN